jgi:hypothetical protein
MKTLTVNDITPEVKAAVAAYLLARTFAECKREQVDAVEREALAECPLPVLEEFRERGRPEYITDPRLTYMAKPDEFAEHCRECSARERERGIKPADMPEEHCPALVAENARRRAEQFLIECAARMLEAPEPEKFGALLLCDPKGKGLERRQRFVDLTVGLVVNAPGFTNPLTCLPVRP